MVVTSPFSQLPSQAKYVLQVKPAFVQVHDAQSFLLLLQLQQTDFNKSLGAGDKSVINGIFDPFSM